jgi:Zn-dependent protease with chaperone function
MHIQCATKRGTRLLNASTDNLVLLGVFVVALFADLPASLIGSAVSLFIIVLATEIFSRLKLSRLGARQLRSEQSPALVAMINKEAGALGVARFAGPEAVIFCVPNAKQATAFVLGGFAPKLVVTGRLAVGASVVPTPTEIIIRHEIAHIANRDARLWLLYISSALFFIPSLFVGMNSPEAFFHPTRFFLVRFIGLSIGVIYTLVLFRRREYLADGLALNLTKDRNLYLQLLSGGSSHASGWFRPSRADRIAAIEYDSPVLRTNLLMILMLVSICASSISFVLSNRDASSHYEQNLAELSLLAGTAIALFFFFTVLVFEFIKGPQKKIPYSLSDVSLKPTLLPGSLSKLAALLGVGGTRINWYSATAFLCATVISWYVSNVLHGLLFHTTFEQSLLSVMAYGLAWCVAWLLALRFTRSLFEVGVAVGLLWIAVVELPGIFRLTHSINSFAEVPFEFWSTVLAVVFIGIAVKTLRNTWMALWIGTMANVVFVTILRYIISEYIGGAGSDLGGSDVVWAAGELKTLGLIAVTGVVEAAVFASILVIGLRISRRSIPLGV